jgi:hypothetical protein
MLRPQCGAEEAHACEVPAWPVKACDQALHNWVEAGREHDRDRCGRSPSDPRRNIVRNNHGDLSLNQIVRQRPQPFRPMFGKAIFDGYILAFDKALFA